MTAIEVLERSISKLETLRDQATPGPWVANHRTELDWLSKGRGGDDHEPGSSITSGDDQTTYNPFIGTLWPHRNGRANTDLIVALSRTVEPTLALLGKMLDAARATGEAHPDVLALARAILGEEKH